MTTPINTSLADDILETVCMDIRGHKSAYDIALDVLFPQELSEDDKLVIELLKDN